MAVVIQENGGKVHVEAPYHPEFPSRARQIGGKWNGKLWAFDPRDESRVRDLCVAIYGDDGSPQELVTVQIVIEDDALLAYANRTDTLWCCGRQVARVLGRDSGARLGEGVVVTEGRFVSGGSRKNPLLLTKGRTVVEVRDVPRRAAENEVATEAKPWSVEIVGSESVELDAVQTGDDAPTAPEPIDALEATLIERDTARVERDRARQAIRLVLALANGAGPDVVQLALKTREQLERALGDVSAEEARAALIREREGASV